MEAIRSVIDQVRANSRDTNNQKAMRRALGHLMNTDDVPSEIYIVIGNWCAKIRNRRTARWFLLSFLSVRLGAVKSYRTLATNLNHLGSPELAVLCLKKALEIYPSDVGLYTHLGWTLVKVGDAEEARKSFCAAASLSEGQTDLTKAFLAVDALIKSGMRDPSTLPRVTQIVA